MRMYDKSAGIHVESEAVSRERGKGPTTRNCKTSSVRLSDRPEIEDYARVKGEERADQCPLA